MNAKNRQRPRAFDYGVGDLWALLRSPVGRRQLRLGASWLVWPLFSTAAALWRRTVLRTTPIVAIVGSYGKTTTARAVAAALGLPGLSQESNSWSFLAASVLRHRGPRPLVVEVGISRAGQMKKYARMLRPDAVVLTSIGAEHRLSLGDLAAITREKAEMVLGLAPGGVAILNGDDPRALAAAPREKPPTGSAGPGQRAREARRILRYGFGEACDLRGAEMRLDWPRGSALRLAGMGFDEELAVGLVGRESLRSVLAAATVARALDVAPRTIAERLRGFAATPGRMQPVSLPSGAIVLRDDFKSGLETIHAALTTLGEIPARRKLVALGDITEPEGSQYALYRDLGERVAGVASRLFYLGHKFQPLASGATAAGLARSAISEHKNFEALATALARELVDGDVVLLKGRIDQKLGRVALLLLGQAVGCQLISCRARGLLCENCRMVAGGWGNRRAVT